MIFFVLKWLMMTGNDECDNYECQLDEEYQIIFLVGSTTWKFCTLINTDQNYHSSNLMPIEGWKTLFWNMS